jgi:hypothetical protein
MTTMRSLAAAAFAVALCLAAPPTALAARGSGTTGIAGKVLVAGGRTPIAGASLRATSAAGTFTAVSNAKGTYTITAPAGDYLVRCDADRYDAAYRPVTVRSSSAVLDFSLLPTVATSAAIAGTVRDASGPLAGALVEAAGADAATVADALGRYRLALPAGTFEVAASAPGHLAASRLVTAGAGQTAAADFTLSAAGAAILSAVADPPVLLERGAAELRLTAALAGPVLSATWTQAAGPRVPLVQAAPELAIADVSGVAVAAETTLVFDLVAYDLAMTVSWEQVAVDVVPADVTPMLGAHVQLGGSTTAVARATVGGTPWAFWNVGTALHATPIGMARGPVSTLVLPGTVQDLLALPGADGALTLLAAVGAAGVAVVDATDPAALALVSVTPVNHHQDGIAFTDTGGTTTYDNVIFTTSAPIVGLATDGARLFLADAGYGIHRTALSNLLPVPVLEADGTLLVEAETYTLQFAGENPWGAPRALTLAGGKLYAALSELGLGIFDPETLARVGGYNLYTDEARLEDHFGALRVTEAVGRDPATGDLYLDDATGMPDHREVWWEVTQVMKADVVAPTPWADFDRRGKWFYEARDVDVAAHGGRTIAYVAYSLGGLVAVDVTQAASAGPGGRADGTFLGWFPAVAPNGPEDTRSQPSSILPYEGAGMFKESGVVAVDVSGDQVFVTDHFAGLVLVDGASAPELRWRGPRPPYDNRAFSDYVNVVSYDMAPQDPLDNESLPRAFFQAPALLATSELAGHGNDLLVLEPPALAAAGAVDVLVCSGAGGFVFVDVTSLTAPAMSARHAVPAWFPTTDEVGAFPDGTPGQPMAIGHTSGVAASGGFLYVADGPHGVSAWNLTDAAGIATRDVHVVANTVQDEYPVTVGGATIYPPSHVSRAVWDPLREEVWALCGRNGVRRVDVRGVEAGAGAPGAPLLLALDRGDLYEHNSDFTLKELSYQDHAYDLELSGNYAWAADGSNGLTVYDTSKDPSSATSGFFVTNLGYLPQQPPLGTASGVELWTDPATLRRYALVAAGPYGVGVVEVTDPSDLRILKVFEPIKLEDGDVGTADGQAIDVAVIGDRAYFTYDSFGVVCYELADLVAPLPAGVNPTEIFKKQTSGQVIYDHRPLAAGRFKLQLVPGYEDVDGGAVRLDWTAQGGRIFLYVAFGEAGLVKLDFTDPAAPALVSRTDTAAEASDVVIVDGRVFIADGSGGLVFLD